jgi:hypothetical protein
MAAPPRLVSARRARDQLASDSGSALGAEAASLRSEELAKPARARLRGFERRGPVAKSTGATLD